MFDEMQLVVYKWLNVPEKNFGALRAPRSKRIYGISVSTHGISVSAANIFSGISVIQLSCK